MSVKWPKPTPPNTKPGAMPIFIDQGKVGLLFFHGFTGSPYEGREFARYFSRKGYGVWVPLLPGHGTEPEALETIKMKDWLEAAEENYRAMTDIYDKVMVCGQSMGGALALHVASKFDVEAVVTFAAALRVDNWMLNFLSLTKYFVKYRYKTNGPDVADPEVKNNHAAYLRYPMSALSEFLVLIDLIKRELPKVTAPALIVHALKDHTISHENADLIYNAISSEFKKKLILEESFHIVSLDLEKLKVFEAVEAHLKKFLLSKAINQ